MDPIVSELTYSMTEEQFKHLLGIDEKQHIVAVIIDSSRPEVDILIKTTQGVVRTKSHSSQRPGY